jgi:adenylate cyclase
MSERMEPTQLQELLNAVFNRLTDIIRSNRGTIDKYMGDCVMAEFGVPVPLDDHAVRACRAALRMRDELRRLRDGWRRRGMPALHARIGINTGRVLVGNLGSRQMMDYTCMGDEVNVASRLEGVNREYGTEILVSRATWEAVKAHFIGREIDRVRVVGREEPVPIHELVATREAGVDADTAALLDGFGHALSLCRARRYGEALTAFQSLAGTHPHDGPTAVHLERCREYVIRPPSEEWDGVHQLAAK